MTIHGLDLHDPMGLKNFLDPERIKERKIKPYEEKLEKEKDKVEFSTEKIAALAELSAKLSLLKSSTDNLRYGNAFNQKTAALSTTDAGFASDYVDVSATGNATLGNFSVAVNSVATNAKLVFNQWFAGDHNFLANTINMTVTRNGVAQHAVINIAANDQFTDVQRKFNLALNQYDVQANLVQNNDSYSLSLVSTTTGAATIAAVLDNAGDFLSANLIQINGANAQITVNQQVITNSSNNFIDLWPGVSITAKKANNGLNAANVNIISDTGNITTEIASFLKTLKDYNEFAGIQCEKDSNDYKDTAYIARSNSMSAVQSYVSALMDTMNNDSNLNSFGAMGIGIVDIPGDDNKPSYKTLSVTNLDVFEDTIKNNTTAVQNLFMDNFTATPNVANLGSTVAYAGTSAVLSAGVINSPIALTVNINANGSIITPTFIGSGGVVETATYNAATGSISFGETSLEGLQLSFDAHGVVNTNERFTLNITQGMINILALQIDSITNNAKNGMADVEIYSEFDILERNKESKVKAQEELDRIKAEVDKTLHTIDMLQIKAGLMMNFFDQLALN